MSLDCFAWEADRRLKPAPDIHLFAGRGQQCALTAFINRRISDELKLNADDTLVDIGCGDGALLKLAAERGVKTMLGLAGTEQEAERLRATGLNVVQGFSDNLPVPNGVATVVVCNSVLLIVPEDKIRASLQEIARIAKPNARIWIGEIPEVPEIPSTPKHATVPEMLWWVLRKRGLRSFLGMCRRLITGVQRGPALINPLAAVYWAPPEAFIEIALEAGLRCDQNFPHLTLDQSQKVVEHDVRHDYLFSRL